MQNKPNSSIADYEQGCAGTPAPRPAALALRGPMVQTHPIWPERIVRNKANSEKVGPERPSLDQLEGGLHEETTMRHRLDAPLRSTKPNLGTLGNLGGGALGELLVQNKANLQGGELDTKCFSRKGLGDKVSGLWR